MNDSSGELKRIEFSSHARPRMVQRGTMEEHVEETIRLGERTPARQGRSRYRLNRQFERDWRGRYYRIQQIDVIVVEEEHRTVVVTVLTYYF